MHGCVKDEGLVMKISAIQNYEPARAVSKMNKNRNLPRVTEAPVPETKPDTVSFKAHGAAKGFGICALLGAGALTVFSGGAAAPLVYGLFAATTGAAGGILGHLVDQTNKKDDNENKNS